MGPIDTGPTGCWVAALVMAVIGVLATIGAIFWVVWWVASNLHWA
jgi:NhaP-type Na+/H+ or K+/H+ antiporter